LRTWIVMKIVSVDLFCNLLDTLLFYFDLFFNIIDTLWSFLNNS
jgi:hypothetical protein